MKKIFICKCEKMPVGKVYLLHLTKAKRYKFLEGVQIAKVFQNQVSKNFTSANESFCHFKFSHNRINGFSAVAVCAGICGLPMRINPSKLLAQWQLPNSSSIKSCQHVPTKPDLRNTLLGLLAKVLP